MLLTGRKAISRSRAPVNPYDFWQQLMIFYHSRLGDEPTGTIESLQFLWFLSNVVNSIETKVLHKTTRIVLYWAKWKVRKFNKSATCFLRYFLLVIVLCRPRGKVLLFSKIKIEPDILPEHNWLSTLLVIIYDKKMFLKYCEYKLALRLRYIFVHPHWLV